MLACSASYYAHRVLTDFRPRREHDQFNHDLNDCEKIRANILVTQKAAIVQVKTLDSNDHTGVGGKNNLEL